MRKSSIGLASLAVGLLTSVTRDATADERPAEARSTTISFARGQWDSATPGSAPLKWTPLRLANQPSPCTFTQLDDALATTPETFKLEDWQKEMDNAILATDLNATDFQIEVTFNIGKGIHDFSAPGVCLAPEVKDGVVQSCIAVFVADYTMAAWQVTTAPDGKTVEYRHLFQLGRWNDPSKLHVLRARVSAREKSLALGLDDSDVIAFSYVGNPALSLIRSQLNSTVGIWGCHGECVFREMTITTPGDLPFMVKRQK